MAVLLVFVLSGSAWGADAPPQSAGAWSLLPPLAAIALAVWWRRVLLPLLLGVYVGALILAGGNPLTAALRTLADHLWPAVADFDHLRVISFTVLMGMMVGLVSACGGMQGLVNCLAPLARSRRSGQITCWGLGLLIFFDDYANTVLLGNTWRPISDRLRISRAKLAYLVDSTAAPVAGLAMVSTWVATEVGYIGEGLQAAGLSADAYAVFLATIPYRFYALWALVFVLLVAWLQRDFGPMLRAERAAVQTGLPRRDMPAAPVEPSHTGPPPRWYNAAVPVAVVVIGVLGWLYHTGRQGVIEADLPPTLWNILGQSDSYAALLYASLAGVAAAVALVAGQRLLTPRQTLAALAAGGRLMVPGLLVLVLAWSLSDVTARENLGTGVFLGDLLQARLPVFALPTLVFLLAAVTALATGTSWGTMGILMPLAIQTTVTILARQETPSAEHPILLGAIGGVLAGAIFGDHCSPISDTTVLSSQASACDHLEHVRTQMPYALVVAAVAVVCGTLPSGLGSPAWPLSILGIGVLLGLLIVVGRPAEGVSGGGPAAAVRPPPRGG